MSGRIMRRLLRALPLLLALQLPARAYAQATTTQALGEAISQLAQFQGEVARMQDISRQSIGPYFLRLSYSWCEIDFGIFGCARRATRECVRPVFLDGMQQLEGALGRARSDGVQLEQSYAPTRAWIADLPRFSAGFAASADIVLAIQQLSRQGQVPSQQQRDQVTAALEKLQADLARSASQLDAGVGALAAALQRQSAYREEIRQAIEVSTQSAQQDLDRAARDLSTTRCSDGLAEQINAIRATFANSARQLQASFGSLGAASSGAERSLAVLLGAVVDSRTGMQSVLKLVQAARNDQIGSFLEQLHLAAAKKQWEDLAAAQGRAMLAMGN
jgi:hypothetical protein